MKIYILPINNQFQPEKSPFIYPPHSKDFYVEQDFYNFLLNSSWLTTNNPMEADWHYLPIYWTRWHVDHDYAQIGLDDLQEQADSVIVDDKKTFTICQYDDGPVVNLGNSILFLSSRKIENAIDIPLLSSSHKKPIIRPSKKYLASFIGRISTHPIRELMVENLKNQDLIFISDGNKGSNFFVKKTLESYIALCPRGYGGNSFRFFEVMQLGVVPCLIGEFDTRPFKKWINWDEISLYSNSVENLSILLHSMTKSELIIMGKKAAKVYKEKLTYQKWCQYVIKELEGLNDRII